MWMDVSFCHVNCSDHIDYTISRYRSRIHRSVRYRGGRILYDIIHERTSHACAAHIPQQRHLRLIDVARRAHHPWLPPPHLTYSRPIMQRIGSLGWGLGDGTSGGLNYACRKADCARPSSVKVVMISTLQRLSSVHSL